MNDSPRTQPADIQAEHYVIGSILDFITFYTQ